MTPNDLAKWDSERRWDYIHAVLCMDAIVPLYRYIGLPFRAEEASAFTGLLREYRGKLQEGEGGSPMLLPQKRDLLLERLESVFGAKLKNLYIAWVLQVFVYLPAETSPGPFEWFNIFMRCSVRTGWWPRLGLPTSHSSQIQEDLENTKDAMEDARDLRDALAAQEKSAWDVLVMKQQGMNKHSIEMGEPFSAVLVTANDFLFATFWVRLLDTLSPADLELLWKHGKAVAQELQISPANVVHPGSLNIGYARWWSART